MKKEIVLNCYENTCRRPPKNFDSGKHAVFESFKLFSSFDVLGSCAHDDGL